MIACVITASTIGQGDVSTESVMTITGHRQIHTRIIIRKGICGQTVINQESRHTGAGAATYIRQRNVRILSSMKGRK